MEEGRKSQIPWNGRGSKRPGPMEWNETGHPIPRRALLRHVTMNVTLTYSSPFKYDTFSSPFLIQILTQT